MLHKLFQAFVPAILLVAGLLVIYAVAFAVGLETVSVTFLLGFPILAGLVIMHFRPKGRMQSFLGSIAWLVGIIGASLFGSLVSGLEGLVCVAMAAIPILGGALIGGVLYVILLRWQAQNTGSLSIITLPICAFLMIDALPSEPVVHTISHSVLIDAPASSVFGMVKSIPDIGPDEIQTRASHLLGIPKPTQAIWIEGPDGPVRHSYWGDSVHFHEVITAIELDRRIAWTFAFPEGWVAEGIEDPHIAVGGDYFDVLSGEYQLEDLDGQTKLTLVTRTYDNSGLGAYAAFWHHFFFDDFHEVILDLVKTRSEAQQATL